MSSSPSSLHWPVSRWPSAAFVAIAAATVLGGCAAPDSATTASTSAGPGLGAPSSAAGSAPSTVAAPTKSSTAKDQPAADFKPLLLTADDVTDSDDRFTQRAQEPQPNDTIGASAFFVNDKDTRAISDTFTIYPDPAAAGAALEQAAATLPTLVTGGKPTPFPVGADGVLTRGKRPEEAKDVTILFFTEGRALVRLEFQSATGDATTDRFVTSIGKMQRIALRVGLTSSP